MGLILGDLTKLSTKGERRLYKYLKDYFEPMEDVFIYYDYPIGDYRPDFLILGRTFGVLAIEVKDYLPENIKTVYKNANWPVNSDNDETLTNPFEQLFEYFRIIKDNIKKTKALTRAKIPIKNIAAFVNIPKDSDIGIQIREVKPSKDMVCFREDCIVRGNFFEFLRVNCINENLIESGTFDLLRGNLIPSARLPELRQTKIVDWIYHLDKIKLLDAKQEKMAMSLGEGHRIFYGVAGSGKTVLLVARARYLAAKYPDWSILVLCFNKILSSALKQMVSPRDYDADLSVFNFHKWARHIIRTSSSEFERLYDEKFNEAKAENRLSEFFDEIVPELLKIVVKFSDLRYDAILIDEGQDFRKEWYEAIMRFLNPKTKSLLITLDGLQGIYAKRKLRWSEVGIDARGRVKKFRESYRTPIEVGLIASSIIPNHLQELINTDDEFLRTEAFLGRNGGVELYINQNCDERNKQLIDQIKGYLRKNFKILILMRENYEKKNWNHPLLNCLKASGLKWSPAEDWNQHKADIFVGTLHGTKGLEAEVVIIPNIDRLYSDNDRQLLYVGMTRCMHKLLMTAEKRSALVNELMKSDLSVIK